jgi:hypothetical protein
MVSNPNVGVYRTITDLTASINGLVVFSGPVPALRTYIAVYDNLVSSGNVLGSYAVNGGPAFGNEINGLQLFGFSLTLTDDSHTAFDNDALPSSPPSINSFAMRHASFTFRNASAIASLTGHLTQVSAVPLPAGLLLFGTGLTALIGLGVKSWHRLLHCSAGINLG